MPARVPSKVPAIPRSEIISVVPTVTPPSLGENSLLQTEHFRTSARRDTIAQALLALIHKVRGIGILRTSPFGHSANFAFKEFSEVRDLCSMMGRSDNKEGVHCTTCAREP